jgi:hypothetical protein
MKKILVAVLGVLLLICAIGVAGAVVGGSDEPEPAIPTTAVDVPTCVAVSDEFATALDVPGKLAAVQADDRVSAYYVSNSDGGTWIVDKDPSETLSPGTARVILPLNATARAQSTWGTAWDEGHEIYQGIDGYDLGAVLSRECAAR